MSCAYCNEFDSFSQPVPAPEMFRRIDFLAALGTGTITISGGEPLLHPQLDDIIRAIRGNGIFTTLITNGYLLTVERIRRLNRAGLDHLQISIDNVLPDEVSKKSLKVLDRKLEWLSRYAEFDVNINSVVGSSIRNPEDALLVAGRAIDLGLTTTVGLIHDPGGGLKALDEKSQRVYDRIVRLGVKSFSNFAYYTQFQNNLARGLPNDWHCRAGSRYLYVCEDGLVHWCSQQRGYPGIPLAEYTREDIEREYGSEKPCAPYCTVSCVHQVAMIDRLREDPLRALAEFFPEPGSMPRTVTVLRWIFLSQTHNSGKRLLKRAAMRLFGVN